MRIHQDWSTAAFDLAPCAPLVGPFAGRRFLETWWRHRGRGEVMLAESDRCLLPLCTDGATVSFLGEADLTDYHAPLGSDADEAVQRLCARIDPGVKLTFDSMPAEAADLIESGLGAAGLTPGRVEHQVAAVLDLPASHDDYLEALGSKERHELRRKQRRFEETLGEASLVRDPGRLPEFVSMHREAPGDKGEFMTPEMEAFFAGLLEVPGAVLDVLLAGEEGAVAAAFGFEDGEGYYLYNSAFSTRAAPSSPGVVLIGALIERAIAGGRSRFDFLKGDETYKFRLGAERRPLFRVEAVR